MKMRWRRWLAALVAILVGVPAGVAGAQEARVRTPRPKLVLAIMVDQFRHVYLDRFAGELHGGLARLVADGAVFDDAQLAHYPTVTAVGHSTLLSGALPSSSGIIGNEWFDRALGRKVTSVWDPSVALLGAPGEGASPWRLLASTVGDQLKISQPGSKVVGISRKDRAAILPAGRMANAAYWIDEVTGNFVSSSWYFTALPAWVDAFNQRDLAGSFAGREWRALDDESQLLATLPSEPRQKLVEAVGASPFSNEMLLEFARAALSNEQLGQRGVTDLLTVSFSANDSVGHEFGPESPQLRDITLRTDRQIEQLFEAVDASVGLENTLVVFSSDHGVAPVPEDQAARHMPGGRLAKEDLFGPIDAALDAAFGPGDWIRETEGTTPYLDAAFIRQRGLDPAEVRRVAARAAAAVPHVARVFTREQLLTGQVPREPASRLVERSYNPERSGDLEILLEPFWIMTEDATTHGSPYVYDTHIPLIFMGWGIRPGRYHASVTLDDVAPTLATLLSVEIPSNSCGNVLDQMFQPVTR